MKASQVVSNVRDHAKLAEKGKQQGKKADTEFHDLDKLT